MQESAKNATQSTLRAHSVHTLSTLRANAKHTQRTLWEHSESNQIAPTPSTQKELGEHSPNLQTFRLFIVTLVKEQ